MHLISKHTLVGLALLFPAIALAVPTIPAHKDEYPVYPTINYGTGDQAAQLKRGEYLTKAGDCIACHTKPGGTPFTGGLGIKTPFGTFYTPNITPDKKTGIGGWTDQQFIHAMRDGVNPKGQNYFPVFPYLYFTHVNTQDIKDIKAYLDALPPVYAPAPKMDVPFPFSWRFAQYGWKTLFFYPYKGEFKKNPEKSKQWNRGAYLVQGLGHCSMCHTPINLLGAPKRSKLFTGGVIDGYYAPNITSANLGKASIDEVIDVFVHDRMLGGKNGVRPPVLGPMRDVNHESLMYLSRDDLASIVVYLKTIKGPVVKSSGRITAGTGKKIYENHCAACHGAGLAGAPKFGDAADWKARLKMQGMPALYKNAINGLNAMPAKGTCMSCSDDEIDVAVDYMVHAIEGGHVAEHVAIASTAHKPVSIEDGKKIYDNVCSICHAKGLLGAPVTGDKTTWRPLIKKNIDILITNTIKGYNAMPSRGACYKCSDAEVIAAVKYIVEESKTQGDYKLW